MILLLGGISAGVGFNYRFSPKGKPGWWDAFIGPGRALDTSKFSILSIDYAWDLDGSGREQSVTPLDQAALVAALQKRLALKAFHGVIGCSYGGLVALSLAQHYPQAVNKLITICCSHKSHPTAAASRYLQRRILRRGIAEGDERNAVANARALAMIGYRSEKSLNENYTSDSLVSYLKARGEAFARQFSATKYLNLSGAIDAADIDPNAITAPSLCVGFHSDRNVPAPLVSELAEALGGPTQELITDSEFGHDAFLKEADYLNPIIGQFLSGIKAEHTRTVVSARSEADLKKWETKERDSREAAIATYLEQRTISSKSAGVTS